MLGHSHATSGALVWAAAAAVVPAHVMGIHLGISDLLLGTFVCAGAALLPDIDHPDGTIAHFLGPISHALCRFISWISGGHRHATHSFFFVALVTFGTWEGVHHLGKPFTLAMTYVMLSLAVRALHLCPPGKGIHSWGVVVLLAAAGTAAAYRWMPSVPDWMPIAVGLGSFMHLFGDCLTKEGCPLLWPVPARMGVPLIRHTGNKLETAFLSPAMTVGACVLLWVSTAPGHLTK